MDKVLKPARLVLSPESPTATREYRHWLHTYENFAATLSLPQSYINRVTNDITREMMVDQLKLDTLTNLISADIWDDIKDCTTYGEAKLALDDLFIRKPSSNYARYKLLTTRQTGDQTLEAYRRTLDKLSRDCNFTDVTATRYREDMVLGAFLAGISNNDTRKRLLEEKDLTFDDAFKLAISRQESRKEAGFYEHPGTFEPNANRISLAAVTEHNPGPSSCQSSPSPSSDPPQILAAVAPTPHCGYCGKEKHPRYRCPARNDECKSCGRDGHWAAVCRNPNPSRRPQ